MAIVGDAWVRIRALNDKLNSDIQKGLEAAVGKDVGDKVGKQIAESIETSTIKESSASAKRIGEKVGSDVEKRVNENMRRRKFSLPEFDSAKTRRSLSRAFSSLSVFFEKIDAPLDNFARSMEGMARRVDKASRMIMHPMRTLTDSITGATIKLGAMPAVLGTVGSALSSLAGAAFSMSAAIAPAFNTLATLPGLLTAVVTPAAAGVIAFQGVSDAYEAMVGAMDGSEASLKKLEEKMKSLSPEAQSFVETLFANRDAFIAVREAAGKDLFGPLERALNNIINNGALDGLKDGLQEAGGVLGDLAEDFSELLGNPVFQGRMAEMFESSMTAARNFGDAILNLISWFTTLGAAAAPVTEQFSEWIETITGNWAKNANDNFDQLREKIQEGADVIAQLGDIFGNIWDTLVNLSRVAKTSGQDLLDSFEKATEKMAELTGADENRDKLEKFFENTATNAKALGDIVVAIGGALLGLGNSTAIAEMSDSLIIAVENLGEISRIALDAFGPKLAEVIEKATTLIIEFMEAGGTEGMQAVLPVISKLLDLLTAIVQIPGLATFIGYMAAFGSVFSILSRIKVPGWIKTTVEWLGKRLGPVLKTLGEKLLPRILPLLGVLGRGLAFLAGPVGIVIGVISLLATGFKLLYDHVEPFRNFVDGIVEKIREFGTRIAAIATVVLPHLRAAFDGVITVITNAFNILKTIVTTIWNSIVAFFSGDADKIPGIFRDAFGKIGEYARNILNGLKTIVTNIWQAIVAATSGKIYEFIDAVRNAFQPIVDIVTGVFGVIKTVITTVWNSIVALFTGRADLIPGIIGSGFAKARDFVAKIFGGIRTIIERAWQLIIAVVMGAVTFIRNLLVTGFTNLVNIVVAVWNGLKTAVHAILLGLIRVVVTIFTGLVTFFTNIFKSMRWIVVTVMTWIWKHIRDRVIAIRDAIVTVFTAVRNFINNVFNAIRNRISAIVKAVVSFVVSRFQAMRDTIAAVFKAVRNTLETVWNWIRTRIFTPMRLGVAAVRAAFAAARDRIKDIWKNLYDRLLAGWNWIRDNVFSRIRNGINLVRDAFANVRTRIHDIWKDMYEKLAAGWRWVRDNVFDRFKAGLSSLKTAFSNVRDGIKTVWDKLKSITAKPVNFVLGTVYNDGIAHWWNKIAKAVGLTSLKLPAADLVKTFAKGGFHESHVAQIARGGAMRLWAEPETGGEAYIPLSKRKRKRSMRILQEVAQRFGTQVMPFKDGGITAYKNGGFWDNAVNVVSGIGRGIKGFGNKLWNAGKMAVEIIKDPVKAIKRAISQILTSKGSGGFGGNFIKMIGALPQKFGAGLATKVKSMFDAGEGGGAAGRAGSGGSGLVGNLAAMAATARGLDPSVRVTSGSRPGATTVTGYVSYHARNRAIDMVSNNMGELWDKLYARFGKSSPELFYSGRAFSRFGVKGTPRSDHWDHVHWAMKNGGLLDWVGKFVSRGIPQMAAGGTVAATPGGVLARIAEGGRNERVTPLDRDGLSAGERAVLEAIAANPGITINMTVNAAPGQDENKLAGAIMRQAGWQLRRGE